MSDRELMRLKALAELKLARSLTGLAREYLKLSRAATERAEELIRDHGVAVIPGSAFGVTGSCTIRVAYGALATANANEGMGRLVRGLRKILRG